MGGILEAIESDHRATALFEELMPLAGGSVATSISRSTDSARVERQLAR
jgi:hypothetical protein